MENYVKNWVKRGSQKKTRRGRGGRERGKEKKQKEEKFQPLRSGAKWLADLGGGADGGCCKEIKKTQDQKKKAQQSGP